MSVNPDDVDRVLRWSGALLTPLIALIVAYIAWQQYRTAKERLRLDLFDKRFSAYQALIRFVKVVMGGGEVGLTELQQLYAETETMTFLFGQDVNDYRRELHLKAVRFRTLSHDIAHVSEESKRALAVKEREDLVKWFAGQFQAAPERFAPYLRFEGTKKGRPHNTRMQPPRGASATSDSGH